MTEGKINLAAPNITKDQNIHVLISGKDRFGGEWSSSFDCDPAFAAQCDSFNTCDRIRGKRFFAKAIEREIIRGPDNLLIYHVRCRVDTGTFWGTVKTSYSMQDRVTQIAIAISFGMVCLALILGLGWIYRSTTLVESVGFLVYNSDWMLALAGVLMLLDCRALYDASNIWGAIEALLGIACLALSFFAWAEWLPKQIASYEDYGNTLLEGAGKLVAALSPQIAATIFLLGRLGIVGVEKIVKGSSGTIDELAERASAARDTGSASDGLSLSSIKTWLGRK